MAILKDLIVHGSSRFLNKIYASEIQTPLIEAEAGIIKKLKADDATVVGLLDVKGQLHTNSWSNSNIATIDGSFYITPTIGSTSGTVSITSSSLVFSGTNYAVSSLYLGDGSSITWPQYSKVLVTGQILSNGEWIPLGTLLGQLSSTATAASISINNIKDNKNQTSNVLATLVSNGTTSSNYRNLKVSLYQRATSSTDFRPLGIYMTATGTNGRTFLDIYGGVESLSINNNYGGFAEPNVRIGNLQGLPNVGGQTPSGWGIYTDNGYFKGIIAADQGYIGSGSKYWVIANEEDLSNSENSRSYIYNGTNNIASTVEGIYLGTDGIRNYKDSTHFVTIQNGVIHAKGVNLTGQIIATSGTIGGWNIGTDTNKSLYYGNQTPGATTTNLVLSPTSATNSNAIGGSGTGLTWFISAGKVFGVTTDGGIYASKGKIGGWTIDGNSLTMGTWGTGNSAMICTGSSSAKSIGGSEATVNGWIFTAGANFGVTKTGALYASSANISGKITATSGEIGGITIDNNGKLWITDANISGTINSSHIDVSSISIGSLSGASNYAQKTDVTNAIDNLQIGGRNLILDTATSHSSRTDDTQYIANYIMSDYGKSLMNNTEDYFTLSFDYEIQGDYSTASSDSRIYAMINGTAASPSKPIYVKNALSTGHYSTTCKMTQAQVDSAAGTCRARWNGIVEGCTFTIKNYKVEKGTKETSWTPAPEDTDGNINSVSTIANIALNQSVEYIVGTQTAATGTWKGNTTDNILRDGKTIMYYLPVAGSGNASLVLTLANGTDTAAIPIYMVYSTTSNTAGLSRVTTHYPAKSMIQMTYDATANQWKTTGYNTNVDHMDRTQYALALAANMVISSGRIAVLGLDGKLQLLSSSSFNITCPPLYVATTYSAANVTSATTRATNYNVIGASFNLANTHSIANATANSNVYIVGTLLGDIFTPTTTVLTCAEPSSEDGLYYMLLGKMTTITQTASNAVLQAEHPIYIYKNGKFQKLEATTATSYITQIDNTGIKITPYDQSGNDYLQINSDAISMYRNNIETLKIRDSAIRIGKIGEGQKNVYIDSDSIDIRDNENVLASFTGEDVKFYDGQIKGLEIASFGGANGVRIGNEEETHFVINNSAVKALNNNGTTIFSIGTTDTLIGNTVKVFSGEIVPNEGYSITLNTNQISLSANDEFYIERIILKLKVAASGFDEDGIICQNFQVNQTNQKITLLSHTTKGDPGNFTTISNFIVYLSTSLSTSSNVFKYGTASSLIYSLNGTFSYYNGSSSYMGQIRITYDGSNTLTFNSIINSSSFGDNKFTLVSDEESDSFYRYSDVMVNNKTSYAPVLTFGTRVGYTGPLSTVIGESLYASERGQMSIGRFNKLQPGNIFAVGKGENDANRQNAFTVSSSGNVDISGDVHFSGNIYKETSPLFYFKEWTWNISSIAKNSGWYGPSGNDTPATRQIAVTGYTPIAIAGYSIWGGTNPDWCTVPRLFINQVGTEQWGNPTPAMLQMYIWNQNTNAAATNIKFTVEILYIASNCINQIEV